MEISIIRVDPNAGIGQCISHCLGCLSEVIVSPCGRWVYAKHDDANFIVQFDLETAEEKKFRCTEQRHSYVALPHSPTSQCLLSHGYSDIIVNSFEEEKIRSQTFFWRILKGSVGMAYTRDHSNALIVLYDDKNEVEIYEYNEGMFEDTTKLLKPKTKVLVPTEVSSPIWLWKSETRELFVGYHCEVAEFGCSVAIMALNLETEKWKPILSGQQFCDAVEHWRHQKCEIVFIGHSLVTILIGHEDQSMVGVIIYDLDSNCFAPKIVLDLPSNWKCSALFPALDEGLNVQLNSEDKNEVRLVHLDIKTAKIQASIQTPVLIPQLSVDTDSFPHLRFYAQHIRAASISPCGRLLLASNDSHFFGVDLLLGNEFPLAVDSIVDGCYSLSLDSMLLFLVDDLHEPDRCLYAYSKLDFQRRNINLINVREFNYEDIREIIVANSGRFLFVPTEETIQILETKGMKAIGFIQKPPPNHTCLQCYVKEDKVFIVGDGIVWLSDLYGSDPFVLFQFDGRILPIWWNYLAQDSWAWSGNRLITRTRDCKHQNEIHWLDVTTGNNGSMKLEPLNTDFYYGKLMASEDAIYLMATENSTAQCIRIAAIRTKIDERITRVIVLPTDELQSLILATSKNILFVVDPEHEDLEVRSTFFYSEKLDYTNNLLILYGESRDFASYELENGCDMKRPRKHAAPKSFGSANPSFLFLPESSDLLFAYPLVEDNSIELWTSKIDSSNWTPLLSGPCSALGDGKFNKAFCIWMETTLVLYWVGTAKDLILVYDLPTKSFTLKLTLEIDDPTWDRRGIHAGKNGLLYVELCGLNLRFLFVDLKEKKVIPESYMPIEPEQQLIDHSSSPALELGRREPGFATISPCGRTLLCADGVEGIKAMDLESGTQYAVRSEAPFHECVFVNSTTVFTYSYDTKIASVSKLELSEDSQLVVQLSQIFSGQIRVVNSGQYFLVKELKHQVYRCADLTPIGFINLGPHRGKTQCYISDGKVYTVQDNVVMVGDLRGSEPVQLYTFQTPERPFVTNKVDSSRIWWRNYLITRYAMCNHECVLHWMNVYTGELTQTRHVNTCKQFKLIPTTGEAIYAMAEVYLHNTESGYQMAYGYKCTRIPLPDALLEAEQH